ncbi:MAG: acetylxylan esterase [Acidobacteria bacterium]|nr:acetylxylan esterase [Acidobacteriota bacterium]
MKIAIVFLSALGLCAQTAAELKTALDRPLLDPNQALVETQVYTASRVPLMPTMASAVEWDRYAAKLRQRVLDEVVFRGRAREWRTPGRKVEWTETIAGTGYKLRKFRFEIVPGFWTSGLLYEPEVLAGKVPVVMNVNGHEGTGIATPYIQQRCMNLARRGMLAVNVEWIGMGQLKVDDNVHYRLAQIDLTGTGGLAVFYLLMERTLDIVLGHANADAERVAVTGLSGGGWQTTMISSLDTRVKVVVPVAGHSSYVTRAQWPDLDLGDSEQTPVDLASVADYTHLTAMVAPRPLMLINNAKDNCCFRADYAVGPLLQSARQVFALYGATDRLRHYVNHSKGHNYDEYSREELYRFLRDQFFAGDEKYPLKEMAMEGEVRKPELLLSPLPAENATLHSLALGMSQGLPRRGGASRERLAEIVRAQTLTMDAREVDRQADTIWWRLRLGGAWHVPAVEAGPPNAREVVILMGDGGKASLSKEMAELIAQGKRVIAIDPFSYGEGKLGRREFLFAMLLSGLGERPLGLEASQVAAIARWQKARGRVVSVESHGRRTGLVAVTAGALEAESIVAVRTVGGLRSLRQILEENLTVDKYYEFFTFGLMEWFELDDVTRLAKHAVVE